MEREFQVEASELQRERTNLAEAWGRRLVPPANQVHRNYGAKEKNIQPPAWWTVEYQDHQPLQTNTRIAIANFITRPELDETRGRPGTSQGDRWTVHLENARGIQRTAIRNKEVNTKHENPPCPHGEEITSPRCHKLEGETQPTLKEYAILFLHQCAKHRDPKDVEIEAILKQIAEDAARGRLNRQQSHGMARQIFKYLRLDRPERKQLTDYIIDIIRGEARDGAQHI